MHHAEDSVVILEYEVHGTIWISQSDDRRQTQGGPIQADQLLNSGTWEQLFTSLRVVDSVVLKRRLYVHFPPTAISLFIGFDVAPTFQPGTYELAVNTAGSQYTLSGIRLAGRWDSNGVRRPPRSGSPGWCAFRFSRSMRRRRRSSIGLRPRSRTIASS